MYLPSIQNTKNATVWTIFLTFSKKTSRTLIRKLKRTKECGFVSSKDEEHVTFPL